MVVEGSGFGVVKSYYNMNIMVVRSRSNNLYSNFIKSHVK